MLQAHEDGADGEDVNEDARARKKEPSVNVSFLLLAVMSYPLKGNGSVESRERCSAVNQTTNLKCCRQFTCIGF